ncbi:MAG: hypothetical protein NZ553_05650 [Caldilinea sp.]|nr:hypothetical protein [Caldilinea sp.]MDW8439943.1 hypothetical protein [Caldilineaceae bacterium]
MAEQFSVQAIHALHHASEFALRTRALSPSPSHVLYGLFVQREADAVKVLTALGHDTEKMLRELKAQLGSRQPVRWRMSSAQEQERMDSALERVLHAAIAEASAVGAPFVSTRDLLVSTLTNPTVEIAEWQQAWQIDVDAVRQAPVCVYEQSVAQAAEQYRDGMARAEARRSHWRLSPIFLGLASALVALGVYLYTTPAPEPVLFFAFVTIGWVVSLALHEFGHALTAYFGGDFSVAERGYLTLNPLKYTHPVLSILMPVLFLLLGGIGLPGGAVYINMGAIRSRRMQSMAAAAGPAANALFAVLLALPFLAISDPVIWVDHFHFWAGMALLIFLQVTAIVFNLLPVPGLDGFGILAPWLPEGVHRALAPFYSFGFLLLILLFWYVEDFRSVFWGIVLMALRELNIPPMLIDAGLTFYRFWL